MAILKGSEPIKDIAKGSGSLSGVYLGSEQVWPQEKVLEGTYDINLSSQTNRYSKKLTDNGSEYNKITLYMDCYLPYGWYASNVGLIQATPFSGGNTILRVRTQDYYNPYGLKTIMNKEGEIAGINNRAENTRVIRKVIYDITTGNYAYYLGDELLFSGVKDATIVRQSMQGDIYLWAANESNGSTIYSIGYKLEG